MNGCINFRLIHFVAVPQQLLLYLIELYDICFVAETCGQIDNCRQFTGNPLAIGPGGIGLILIGMTIHGVIAMIFLVLIESGVFRNMWNKLTCTTVLYAQGSDAKEDKDVAIERIAVKHIFQVMGPVALSLNVSDLWRHLPVRGSRYCRDLSISPCQWPAAL